MTARTTMRQPGHRFDEQVPLLDQTITLNLVIGNASWAEVEAEVGRWTGPSGFVALSRLDEGALLSLYSEPVEATRARDRRDRRT